jgi:hypothetical protein
MNGLSSPSPIMCALEELPCPGLSGHNRALQGQRQQHKSRQFVRGRDVPILVDGEAAWPGRAQRSCRPCFRSRMEQPGSRGTASGVAASAPSDDRLVVEGYSKQSEMHCTPVLAAGRPPE